jgi:hypothetical protein
MSRNLRPIPLGSFIPPVTGTYGRPAAVASNRFDESGNFRTRTGSFKRARVGDDGELDAAFNITRDYPPPSYPPKPLFDCESIKALMVTASEKAVSMKARVDNPNVDQDTKDFASANLVMFDLLSAIVEKAIIPLANAPPPGWPRNCNADPPPTAPKPVPGTKELTKALAIAEKTCIIFDAELGPSPVSNKERLAHVFSATVRAKAISVAEEACVDANPEDVAIDVAEAVRVMDDALSSATNLSFLGQVTKPYTNNRDASDPRNNTFCTLPLKLEFPDRGARIHFERTLREKCKMRASMSLPPGIRTEAEKYRQTLLAKFPGEIVMVRAESEGLHFAGFHKRDGEGKWIRVDETCKIPLSAVLPEGTDGAAGGSQAMS